MQHTHLDNSYDFVNNYFGEKNTFFSRLFRYDTNRSIKRIISIVYKNIDLENSDKELLLIRYINIIKKIENKYKKNSCYYTLSTLFTGLASILITAFISINNLKDNSGKLSTVLWWLAWSLSLGVSLVNMLASFYKWDRKYLLMFRVFYKLEQEMWMFLELVGPYSKKKDIENQKKSHEINLNLFYSRIEFIYKKVNDNLLDIEDNEQDEKDNNTKSTKLTTSEQQFIESQTESNNNFIKLGKKVIIKKDNIIKQDNFIVNQQKKDDDSFGNLSEEKNENTPKKENVHAEVLTDEISEQKNALIAQEENLDGSNTEKNKIEYI